MQTHNKKLRLITIGGLFGAIAFLLMFFSFQIKIISPFAAFDLSALPELIGGFLLGPTAATCIIVIKLILKLIFQGTESMLTGEFQNLILSLSYVLPAVLFYRRHKSKKGALIGLVIGSITSIIMAVITSIYLIFPAYIKLYGMNWNNIIETCHALAPWITNIPTMIAYSIIPFNLISRTVTSILAMLIYKKISIPIKQLIQE